MTIKGPRGVSREVIEHKLTVSEKVNPKKQRLRKMSEEKVAKIKVEVLRLLDVNVIREVK